MSKIRPCLLVKNIYDIDLPYLKSKNINGLIFDLDNTITPWHQYVEDKNVVKWFEELNSKGFKACILSNSAQKRVEHICPWLDLPVIGNARKPLGGGYRRAIALLQLRPEKIAMVGDQIFTDILGGNKAGLFTIRTEPIAERENWYTHNVARRLEKLTAKLWK